MKAYNKEIFRTIKNERRRFLSLIVISALGVLMMTGLKAGCNDTRASADRFYISQHLRDFYIQSTLGLTDEDIKALEAADGVEEAVGFYDETGYYAFGDNKYSVLMSTWNESADTPYIMQGRLPVDIGEIAVTKSYADKFELSVGDGVSIDLDDDSSIETNDYAICGVVLNVTDVNTSEGCTSFRSTAATDYVAYISDKSVDPEIYTGIAVTLKDSSRYNTYSDDYKQLILSASEKIADVKSIRETARTEQIINDALDEIEKTETEMNDEFAKAERELTDSKKKLDEAKKQLDETKALIDTGMPLPPEVTRQYQAGLDSYNEGLEEYDSGRKEFEQKKADAVLEIEDAKKEAKSIDHAKWYISTRDDLSGYMNISSDMGAIDSLSVLFAVVFLMIAVLISLITINRMIEEERGLVGTYMALGYTDAEITGKYLIYGLGAVAAGCVFGDILGYITLPKFLFSVFETMYMLPRYILIIDPIRAVAAPLIFIVSIMLTITATCSKAFMTTPAQLMRPKAPKPGSKVLLERITFIWDRFSFLNKVTARNIFRFKKRLFMTILGVLGCTSLLVVGFGLKDSVDKLSVHQYEEIINYDLLSVTLPDDLNAYEEEADKAGAQYVELQMSSVTISNSDNQTLQTQIYIFDDAADTGSFIAITDINSGDPVKMRDDEIYVTRNAGIILGFKEGDTITLQDSSLVSSKIKVGALIDNYLGNSVYMNSSTFKKHFGSYEPNALMINSDSARTLAGSDYVKTSALTETLKSEFKSGFMVMNFVLYLLIVLSAALAFVVLFTLSSTNISERERELATIKVLGFYDREVHFYINKEIMLLTVTAVLLGLPTGAWLCGLLTDILKMPSLYFSVYIKPESFVYSAAITLAFSLLVNLIMHRTLDSIDPAEALKSIE